MNWRVFPSSNSSIVAAGEDEDSYSSSRRLWSAVCDKGVECTEHSVDRNSLSAVPAVISRSWLYKIVAEHLLFRKLCVRWMSKQLTPERKAKRVESALTIVLHLFLHLGRFLSGQSQRFQNDREVEMSVTQCNPRRQTSTTQWYKSWSHVMTNFSIPEVNILKNSSTLVVSVPIKLISSHYLSLTSPL